MKERKYFGIRKVKWDAFWHALYKLPNNTETYDRVSKKEAMEILKECNIDG